MIKLGDTVTAMSNLNYEITGKVVQIDNSRYSVLPAICVSNGSERLWCYLEDNPELDVEKVEDSE